MDTTRIIDLIKNTESPLKRQLLAVGLISKLLEERGKSAPIVIGGLALSYYTREVYFTADIDLAYSDREAIDEVLKEIGFRKKGRYWVNENLEIAVEVPVGALAGEESPVEVVELEPGLECRIIGLEDLIIDRLNACKHWKSQVDCEMAELLILKYRGDLDWSYLERRARLPENDVFLELEELRKKARQ
ncbi:MAG: hypothetical protein QHH14_12445 [Clostridiales bacterium]|nr:hypothetical protein [Clostridiales bacterium]